MYKAVIIFLGTLDVEMRSHCAAQASLLTCEPPASAFWILEFLLYTIMPGFKK